MLDPNISILFSPFSREIANPIRQRINTERQFQDFISQNNGVHDCFTSVYANDFTIDKLFFDFDGYNAYTESQKVYDYVTNKLHVPIIPIASGKKGIHLHILTKPVKIPDPRRLIRNAQLYILVESLGKEIHSADSHVIGDVRRICRIPNTLRPPENKSYCTFLPEDWVKMSELDILLHVKQQHSYHYNLDEQPLDIQALPEVEVDLPREDPTQNHINVQGKEQPFLKSVLRPCLYNNIIAKNPRHDIRTAATIELLEFLSESQVLNIYSQLGWFDFDSDLTRYHIHKCKTLEHYSCDRLKQLSIPRVCCVG